MKRSFLFLCLVMVFAVSTVPVAIADPSWNKNGRWQQQAQQYNAKQLRHQQQRWEREQRRYFKKQQQLQQNKQQLKKEAEHQREQQKNLQQQCPTQHL